MKIYKLPQLAGLNQNGEYHLGREDLHTDNVYLLYRRLRPRETDHKVSAPPGFEEIIYVIKGRIKVRQDKTSFTINCGEAFHSNEPFYMDNLNDYEAVYIAAGGGHAGDVTGKASPDAGKDSMEPAGDVGVEAEAAEEIEYEITNDGGALKEGKS